MAFAPKRIDLKGWNPLGRGKERCNTSLEEKPGPGNETTKAKPKQRVRTACAHNNNAWIQFSLASLATPLMIPDKYKRNSLEDFDTLLMSHTFFRKRFSKACHRIKRHSILAETAYNLQISGIARQSFSKS